MPENHFTPCIILPGIGQSRLELLDNKGQKVKMAWPMDIDGEALTNSLKASLMKMMLFRKDGGFSDKLADIAKKALEPISLNPDGTMRNSLRPVEYPSLEFCTAAEKRYIYAMTPLQKLAGIIGEENLYFFSYNSFGDVYETAARLDGFIDRVKEERNCERVNLIPISLGGVLSTAYLDAFGFKNDVKRIMYIVSAIEGTQLSADIMKKDILLEKLLSAAEIFSGGKNAEALEGMIKMMPEGVAEASFNKITDVFLENVVLGSTTLWGTVPPGEYPALADKYLSNKPRNVLREKTDRFYKAQSNIREIINERRKNGTEFFSIVGYGLQLLKISASDRLSSDGIINTGSASLGAECAALGEKLGETRGERICRCEEHNHISPDKTLDASFGFMPETTWYFLNQKHDHIAYNDTALEIARRVLSDDSFKDIYSDERLPQFSTQSDNRTNKE